MYIANIAGDVFDVAEQVRVQARELQLLVDGFGDARDVTVEDMVSGRLRELAARLERLVSVGGDDGRL